MEEELQHNKFKNLNVFITGVSSGIGYAVAKAYDERGAKVFGVDIIQIKASKYLSKKFEFFNCEVENYKKMQKIINKIIQKNKKIDILINCAGIIEFKSIENNLINLWKKIIDVNLTGTFISCKIIAPLMKKNKNGSIINVSSRAAKHGGMNETAYCASKFGVEGLSRSLYVECKKYNVVVNTITPGVPIKTSMSKKTYSLEKKKIWQDPSNISHAFLHLGLQTKNGINNKYINAWELSKKIKNKYKIEQHANNH